MTIVTAVLLECQYKDAQNDQRDCTVSAFWQVILQRAFYSSIPDPELDVYSVISGRNANADRIADIVVHRMLPDESTDLPLLVALGKEDNADSRESAVKAAEEQARQACELEMKNRGTSSGTLWAMTTIGLSFRIWSYDTATSQLVPANNDFGIPVGQPDYIDAKDDQATCLYDMVNRIKAETEGMCATAAQ